MKLTVEISYSPQHMLPHLLTQAHWTAETYEVPGANSVYGIDPYTSRGAIEDLIGQLQAKGLSGTLIVNRIHTDDQQEQMDVEARQALLNNKEYQYYFS